MNNSQPNFKSQPTNQNIAQPTRFQMTFARLPNVTFFCQTVLLPGLSAGYATQPTPFVDLKVPGDKLIYEPLTITMLVDEDLQSWREVHNWMRAYTFPTTFGEYGNMSKLSPSSRNAPQPQYSDVTISVFNSTWQRILNFKFIAAFPTSLGALSYSSADGPDSPMVVDVTFDYQYFDVAVTQAVA